MTYFRSWRKGVLAVCAFAWTSWLGAQELQTFDLCPGVKVESLERIELTDAERILACKGIGRPPYQDVPWNQQQYFLRNFLTDRGFFQFTIGREGDDQVRIKLGERSVIRRVRLLNAPFTIRPERFWRVYGRAMTSDALNQMENWLMGELSRAGYPCVDLQSRAFPLSNDLVIDLNNPSKHVFPDVEMELIPGTIGGVERRYNAFHQGETYNSLLLNLTTQRIIEDEIVISANYSARCSPAGDEVDVRISNIAGKPRLVTFALGFDTEEFFMIEGGWRNARLGDTASRLEASLRASFRDQRASLLFDWYYAPFVIRHSLRSQTQFARQFEADFESLSFEARSGPSWTWDSSPNSYDLWTSLNLAQIETIRGEGPRQARSMSLRVDLGLMQHRYEYYRAQPREGYRLGLGTEFSSKGMGADYSESRVTLSGSYLWNLFDLEPAVWILGVRGQFTGIQLGDDTELAEYPAQRRLRLGGTTNMRGFSRQSLPPDEGGALTTGYLGLELRIREILPFGVQPIAFFDMGRWGRESFSFESANFWSPGTGVHWDSLIGTFRATIAHGFVSGPQRDDYANLAQWQIYLSYGEQF